MARSVTQVFDPELGGTPSTTCQRLPGRIQGEIDERIARTLKDAAMTVQPNCN